LLLSFNVKSADFCVNSSEQLESALSTAESNSQPNIIRIMAGNYVSTNSGFQYEPNGNFDIEISGAWIVFFGTPCGLQLDNLQNKTVLDGTHVSPALRIVPNQSGDININNITFINGFATGVDRRGGGFEMFLDASNQDYPGNVLINHCIFSNNSARSGGAVYAHGNIINFENNLVHHNYSEIGGAVTLINRTSASIGTYVINNTLVFNTVDSTSGAIQGGGLVLIVSGNTSKGYVTNNLFWDNDLIDIHLSGNGFFYIYNNDIGNSSYGNIARVESSNLSSPPAFDVGNSLYTPSSASPLLNSGRHPIFPVPFPTPFQHDWSLAIKDLANKSRINNTVVDIGAYEFYQDELMFKDGFE